jgi:hypothetical protein
MKMRNASYTLRILMVLKKSGQWLTTLEICNAIREEEKRAGNQNYRRVAANSTILRECKRLKAEGFVENQETGWGYWHRPAWRITESGSARVNRKPVFYG